LARKPWLAALLFVTFFARVLVPTGFMPGPGGLMLCSGYAPLATGSAANQMPHDMSGMDMSGMDMSSMDMSGIAMPGHSGSQSHGGNSPDHEGSSVCSFAAAAAGTMASSPTAVLIAVVHTVTHRIDLPSQAVIPRDTVVPTSLPRGPPSLA
jgi:hypothetical protein